MNRLPEAFECLTRACHGYHLVAQGGNDVAEQSYRGARVRQLNKPNRTYQQGRVCAADGCQTKLSIYNKWEFCWQHEPVHTYIPRGKRRRKAEAA
jgi:hypothetical protein